MSFKIASWNVNSLKVRLPQVVEWLGSNNIDILALQETKLADLKFPVAEIKAAGYEVVFSGQPTYNGVAVISRVPISDIVTDLPDYEDPQRRVLGVTIGNVRVLNLYVPNGESITSAKYQYKLTWLEKLESFIATELATHKNMVVLGDFNIAPAEEDVHDPLEWVGQVLFSEPERAALQGLYDLGLVDCFRLQPQAEKSFTWWDYRMNGFKRNRGLRIDHILASESLAGTCDHCYIEKSLRALDRPSDHAPIVAEFALNL